MAICTICHVEKDLASFPLRIKSSAGGKKGEPTAICRECTDQRKESRKKRAGKRKAETDDGVKDGLGKDDDDEVDLGEISVAEFLDAVKESDSPVKVRAQVDIAAIAAAGATPRERANQLADAMGNVQLLHWTFENRGVRVRKETEVFSYSCAQSESREHKAKVQKGEKARDSDRMDRFPCDGWLHLTTEAGGLPVEDVELPYSANTVYYYWHVVSREEWRLADSPLESARKFVEERGKDHHIAMLDVEAEPGTEALAFYVTDFVGAWAQHTQELAMDSTWNTNGGNFELFSAVADANGAGIPLAFIFLRTTKDAAAGAKQAVLARFLERLKELGIDPEFTLTDKDFSEINAMGATWKYAKHQLCFWHGLRAVKQRLCKNKHVPAPYNADAAHSEFSFIDPHFLPAAQRSEAGLDPIPPPPEKPLPRVRLLVDGRPPILTPALRIILKPGDIADALGHLRPPADRPAKSGNRAEGGTAEQFNVQRAGSCAARPSQLVDNPALELDDDERSDDGIFFADRAEAGDEWEDEDFDIPDLVEVDEGEETEIDDEDDCRREVDAIERDSANVDPDTPPDTSETGGRSRASDYQFCPACHRLPILRLFTKHACQHPLLPERHGIRRSAEDIYRDAVEEMYRHCKANNLSEVWAYLWNSWYCPSRWKLWARSAYAESIPRKRTTMIVEALWRGIKRLVLHMYNRPPIDLALYAVVTKTLPRYRVTLSRILKNSRPGRPAKLTTVQKDFKRSWERLRKVQIRGEYTTDVTQWTCDCGSQKYHAHLLCKHLVQAVGPLTAKWWRTVVRYHIPPFYTVPIDGETAPAPENLRNHAWIPRMRRKRSAIVPRPPRVQRTAPAAEDSDSDVNIPSIDRYDRSSSPICSSPDKAPPTGRDGLPRSRSGGDCDFEPEDEDEQDLERTARRLLTAVKILNSQVDNPDPRFFRNAVRCMQGAIKWVSAFDKHAVPDVETIGPDDAISFLGRARQLFDDERRPPIDAQRLRKAAQAIQGTVDWVRAVEHAEARRTMAKTNTHRTDEPNPVHMFGYLCPE
ncbi:uncharacterized protein TRAVEDRAFT_19598 [Trametes versicolor FP-101664 SS1]|uniref:uncharacterized protein n=1 Tax=Trametes versicolor (strain FP-101664) TaxID=717944 RepID=UPI0004622CF9|nr:uncharacterized protein TRAVEDRAFT_19598 [Trametes versicolor FP-101664 SS1]EIW59064.1 hypothetical protein TRAVEDRAFT_19598 [Trametes versicolor FP-101664 SS1]